MVAVKSRPKTTTTQADFDAMKRAKSERMRALALLPRAPRQPGAGRPRKTSLKTKRSIAVQRHLHDLKLVAPWLELADMPLARRFCELQVLASAVYFELHSSGAFDSKRQPGFAIETFRRLVLAQIALGVQLGLSPMARRALALNSQRDDLASALARSVDETEDAEGG
jgi:hypothetical protein